MLYTGKGDKGDTGVFEDKKRISKNSARAEALGTVDELNAFLGVCKTQDFASVFNVRNDSFSEVVDEVQQNLFVVQAELAGAEKTIEEEKVTRLEELINTIEGDLPEITSFFVAGGTELGAMFDSARTLARRAERRVVAYHEASEQSVKEHTLAYLNRLSSLLYAMARLTNHKSGITEEQPHY